MATKEASLERFAERGRTTGSASVREIHQEVDRAGRESSLAALHDGVADVVRARPTSVLIPSETGGVDQTYALLSAVLAEEVA